MKSADEVICYGTVCSAKFAMVNSVLVVVTLSNKMINGVVRQLFKSVEC